VVHRSKLQAYLSRLTWAVAILIGASDLLAQCEVQRLMGDGEFASAVAMKGRLAAVGAPGADNEAGLAEVYRFDDPTLPMRYVLRPSRSTPYAGFGASASIDGNVALVGEAGINCPNLRGCGAAYVFRFQGSTWAQEQKLVAEDHLDGDNFGASVSIDGNVAIVGAPYRTCQAGEYCGAAYLYRFDGSNWVQELSARSASISDLFGVSVCIRGDLAVVGSRSAAHVYRFTEGEWVEVQKLPLPCFSVAISGEVIAVKTSQSIHIFRFGETHWVFEQQLVSSSDGPLPGVWKTMSLSGNVAVVGVPPRGLAFIFEFDGSSWVQKERFTAPLQPYGFGTSVAAGDGIALVGSPHESVGPGYDRGAAYLYMVGPDCNANDEADFCDIRDGTSRDIDESRIPDDCEPEVPTQCELKKLTAMEAYDQLGISVSMEGNSVLVGAPGSEHGRGGAQLHRFDSSTWSHEQTLTGSNSRPYDRFGVSLHMRGDVAVVGASEADCTSGQACGAAYMFRPNGSMWIEEQRLTASDGAAYDRFGSSVSVDGDAAVVGAFWNDCPKGKDCGAAYTFRFDGSSWVEQQKLTASEIAPGDFFGYSVSISGDAALVTAMLGDCQAGEACGAVYVFRFNGSKWIEQQKLTASDAAANDQFGVSVFLDGNSAIVGAWLAECAAGTECGAAYVYRFNGSTWMEEQKLVASDAGAGDYFGRSVTLNGDQAMIGAYLADCPDAGNCGAAYVYRFNGSSWTQERKLTAPAGAAFDFFGFAVALNDDLAVVGAYGDDAPPDSGSAFAFSLGTDCNDNDRVDFCDIRDRRSDDADDNDVPDECETIIASLDIKPGACPNRVNRRSHGTLQAALVGSDSFDVRQVDTEFLALRRADGVGGEVRPLSGPPGPRIQIKDVATPFDGELCDCHELERDGIDDLVLRFHTDELVEALELESLPTDVSVKLSLSGTLLDGTPFEASDCILLRGASDPALTNAGSKPPPRDDTGHAGGRSEP